MPNIPALTSFTAATRIKSAEVNSNFSSIRTQLNTYGLFTDVAATVTGVYTFNTAPIFAAAQAFAAAVTVTAGGLTVTAGGLTVTAGGLTVSAGGASISGTCSATLFSGSGASLTSIPQSAVTSLVSDLSGKAASSHNHSGAAITSGTVAAAYLPATFSALTITTLTSTTVVAGALQGAASLPRHSIDLSDGASSLVSISASSGAVDASAGGSGIGSLGGGNFPTGFTGCTVHAWLRVQYGGGSRFIPLFNLS